MIKNIRALAVIGAMVLFPVAVFAEDVPMTEEEVCLEDDYAIEAQTEEEVLIVAEEDEFLEEDGLVAAEDDEELLVFFEPLAIEGMKAKVNTTTPKPPIHCIRLRQKRMPCGW